jgi:crotonobetainyl-CoA:carnitine CoA-transferase CaiB-like acyl-CoA transferase
VATCCHGGERTRVPCAVAAANDLSRVLAAAAGAARRQHSRRFIRALRLIFCAKPRHRAHAPFAHIKLRCAPPRAPRRACADEHRDGTCALWLRIA